jgi:hypothetical protein
MVTHLRDVHNEELAVPSDHKMKNPLLRPCLAGDFKRWKKKE